MSGTRGLVVESGEGITQVAQISGLTFCEYRLVALAMAGESWVKN